VGNIMAKHKGYTVAEGPMGFSVEGGSDRVKVIISLRDAHWLLEDELGMHQEKFGFFEVTKLAKEAAKYSLEYDVDKVMDPNISINRDPLSSCQNFYVRYFRLN
jgi:hypothetical protein